MYTALAKFYDLFMSGNDIVKWTDYVCSLLKKRKSGIDMACGTGRFTLELFSRGYDVFGVDLSKDMLNAANANAIAKRARVTFMQGDMRTFTPNKEYEFIIAMCDAVNYLANPKPFFTKAYEILKQDGLLVFDISSKYKLLEVLGTNTYSDTKGDITYIWNNFPAKTKKHIDMELTFFERTGEYYTKSIETQRQYIHEIPFLVDSLTQVGFTDIRLYGGLTKQKPASTEQRLHFCATKPQNHF